MIALLATVGLLLVAKSEREPERVVRGYGLSIVVPAGWNARIEKSASDDAPILVAGNFALPANETFPGRGLVAAMQPDSIYVWIADLGFGRSREPTRAWERESLPIEITGDDFESFEGAATPAEAVRRVVVEERSFLVIVAFGRSVPTDDALADANDVLARFSAVP